MDSKKQKTDEDRERKNRFQMVSEENPGIDCTDICWRFSNQKIQCVTHFRSNAVCNLRLCLNSSALRDLVIHCDSKPPLALQHPPKKLCCTQKKPCCQTNGHDLCASHLFFLFIRPFTFSLCNSRKRCFHANSEFVSFLRVWYSELFLPRLLTLCQAEAHWAAVSGNKSVNSISDCSPSVSSARFCK